MSKTIKNRDETAPLGALVGFEDLTLEEKNTMSTIFEFIWSIYPQLLEREEADFAIQVGGEIGHYFYPGVVHKDLITVPVFTLNGVYEVSTVNCLHYPKTGQSGLIVQARRESNR